MNKTHLDKAILEAHRFLAVAKETKKAGSDNLRLEIEDCPRLTAATKRASMDLTRALADLRQKR